MSKRESRTFSREFKLEAVRRIEAGENVSTLAREFVIKRAILYRWRDAHRLVPQHRDYDSLGSGFG